MKTTGLGMALAAFAAAVSWQALAQAPGGERLRGTIVKLDGDVVAVKTTDGKSARIKLAGDARIVAVVKASLAEIRPGSYVGSAATPRPDGSQKALEVHIFPEAMRGSGEGHQPNFTPSSTMTNGNVGDAVVGVEGHMLTLQYRGGEKKVLVPAETPVVRYEIGGRGDLQPGTAFSVTRAAKLADGSYETVRINVGRGGIVPR